MKIIVINRINKYRFIVHDSHLIELLIDFIIENFSNSEYTVQIILLL